MSSHREQPPLTIRPQFSRRLSAFVALSHAAAFLAALALPDLWPLVALPVAASFFYQLKVQVRRTARRSIESVVWQSDGRWSLRLVSGRELEARLSPATFVSVSLVVLNFRTGKLGRRALPLFSDALDPEPMRRLRQRLRIEGIGLADPSAAP